MSTSRYDIRSLIFWYSCTDALTRLHRLPCARMLPCANNQEELSPTHVRYVTEGQLLASHRKRPATFSKKDVKPMPVVVDGPSKDRVENLSIKLQPISYAASPPPPSRLLHIPLRSASSSSPPLLTPCASG